MASPTVPTDEAIHHSSRAADRAQGGEAHMPIPRGTQATASALASPSFNKTQNHPAADAAEEGAPSPSGSPQHTPTATAATDDAFAPWEVRALVLALLPLAAPGIPATPVKEVLYQLPAGVQRQVQRDGDGLLAFCLAHFPNDVDVSDTGARGGGGPGLRRRGGSHSDAGAGTAATSSATRPESRVDTAPPPPPKTASTCTAALSSSGGGDGGPFAPFRPGRAHTTIELLDAIVEFIPTFFVTADAVAATVPSEIQSLYADTSFSFFLKRFRHYIDIRTSHGHAEVRLKPDFDHPKRGRADEHHGGGMAGRFGAPAAHARGSLASSTGGKDASVAALPQRPLMGNVGGLARPPRNSEANLIQYIVPRMPKEFTPLAEVLQEVSDIVSRHPSFDPRLGVTGLLEKYPEYFQLVDGKLRARPYKSAPNSLDDLDVDSSPLPAVFAKIQTLVDAAAAGKNYLEEADKVSAMVPTGKLYAQLTAEEKRLVKERCRSFPRFLRMHGKAIAVSGDSMKVYKFKPEYEPCADTILDRRLAMNAISPDDPILKIPAEMDEKTQADWAVKELYDSLPLTQCAELEDILSLVPPAVRDALPKTPEAIATEVLSEYPEYFMTWRYPDDESVIIIQRAKVTIPDFAAQDIVRMTFPVIPQGGMELSALQRRVPLPLQRFFYRHGMRRTLGGLPQHFRIAGDRIIRLG